MDSGYTIHVTGQEDSLLNIQQVANCSLTTIGGKNHLISGKRDVMFKANVGEMKVANVLYLGQTTFKGTIGITFVGQDLSPFLNF